MKANFLTLTALALAASVLPAEATTITLNTPGSVTAGSSFDVTVQISDVFQTHPGDALAAFGFNVVVGNSSIFSYTGETIGPLFDDFSGIFGASPQVAGIATAIFLAAGDFTEPLTLATLHFTALTSGSASIGISTDLSDPNQGLFYSTAGADALNGSVRVVSAAAAVPEPASFLLGGLGLVGLWWFRRKSALPLF